MLFVCTANLCRSPVAEHLARDQLAGCGLIVGSAGVHAHPGTAMDDDAAAALQGRRLDVGAFRTRRLDAALLAGPALVLVATRRHRAAVAELDPRAGGRTLTLPEMARYAAALDTTELDASGSPRGRLVAVVSAAVALRGTLAPERPGDDDVADPYRQGATAMRATVTEIDAWLRPLTALLIG